MGPDGPQNLASATPSQPRSDRRLAIKEDRDRSWGSVRLNTVLWTLLVLGLKGFAGDAMLSLHLGQLSIYPVSEARCYRRAYQRWSLVKSHKCDGSFCSYRHCNLKRAIDRSSTTDTRVM